MPVLKTILCSWPGNSRPKLNCLCRNWNILTSCVNKLAYFGGYSSSRAEFLFRALLVRPTRSQLFPLFTWSPPSRERGPPWRPFSGSRSWAAAGSSAPCRRRTRWRTASGSGRRWGPFLKHRIIHNRSFLDRPRSDRKFELFSGVKQSSIPE